MQMWEQAPMKKRAGPFEKVNPIEVDRTPPTLAEIVLQVDFVQKYPVPLGKESRRGAD